MRKRRTKTEAEIMQNLVRIYAKKGLTYKEISKILKLKSPQLACYYFRTYPQKHLQSIKNKVK